MSAPFLPGCESSLGPACLPISHFSVIVTMGLVFKSLLFYLTKAPKCKSRNAGNLHTPKRNRKVLPLSEKVKILSLIRGEKWYAEVPRSTVRTNLPSVRLWRRKKKFMLVVLLHLLGLSVGHIKIYHNGLLIVLNWSCLRSSWCKKENLTLLSVSPQRGKYISHVESAPPVSGGRSTLIIRGWEFRGQKPV